MTTSRGASPRFAGPGALLRLMVAGLVLAASWAVEFPDSILAAAWTVACLAVAFVAIIAFRESRAQGIGFLRSLGRMFRDLGRFVLAFF